MSVGRWIQGHQDIAQALPELAALSADPAELLARQTVHVRRARPPFGLLLLCLLIFPLVAGIFFQSLLAVQIALALAVGLSIAVLVRYFYLRAGLLLTHAGVELQDRRGKLCCPWSLFDAPGCPSSDQGLEVALPINRQALPEVERVEDGVVVGRGTEAQSPHLHWRGSDEVVLRNLLIIAPAELGELLLQLGQRLGPLSAPAKAHHSWDYSGSSDQKQAPALEPDGWFEAPLTKLMFPPACCECGAPTEVCFEFSGSVRFGWLLGIAGSHWEATVPIPWCEACQKRRKRGVRRWIFGGLAVGLAITAVAAGLLLLLLPPDHSGRMLLPATGLGLLLGLGLGWAIGSVTGLPVHLARYRPFKGTIAVRFRRRDYAEEVLAAMAECD